MSAATTSSLLAGRAPDGLAELSAVPGSSVCPARAKREHGLSSNRGDDPSESAIVIDGSVRAVDAEAHGSVRRAADADMAVAARLLHNFNLEFAEPTPLADVLAERLRHLVACGDTVVLVAGEDPVGLAVLRLRGALPPRREQPGLLAGQ